MSTSRRCADRRAPGARGDDTPTPPRPREPRWRARCAHPAPGHEVSKPYTDRGCQYTAAYQAALVARGIVCSMSRAGECLDNAMAESFFATLKAELIAVQVWPTRAA